MSDLLTILQGDCLTRLRELPSESVQCCVTSPPYWGLRDYGVKEQIGLEKTPEEYVAKMVAVFREVRRVLRDDGVMWINLGDSYAGAGYSNHANTGGAQRSDGGKQRHCLNHGIKPKDLVGIPWLTAFALRADGWWLRQDIIWAKPNPMPESVKDRCTKAHEYIFLLSKSADYFYDNEAIKEPSTEGSDYTRPVGGLSHREINGPNSRNGTGQYDRDWEAGDFTVKGDGRNKRSVWTIATNPYAEAHFATFPPDLIKPCILAGSKTGDMILDPFGGSGTTGQVALEFGRRATLIELNPEYVKLMQQRCDVTPGLAL